MADTLHRLRAKMDEAEAAWTAWDAETSRLKHETERELGDESGAAARHAIERERSGECARLAANYRRLERRFSDARKAPSPTKKLRPDPGKFSTLIAAVTQRPYRKAPQ